MTPTQRTLAELVRIGRTCGIVERFNPHVKPHGIRQDLFGFIDIISLDKTLGIVGVQSTGTAFSQHVIKIETECEEKVKEWLRCKGSLELWGWRKVKEKRGGKRMVYKPRLAFFYLTEDGNIRHMECDEKEIMGLRNV